MVLFIGASGIVSALFTTCINQVLNFVIYRKGIGFLG